MSKVILQTNYGLVALELDLENVPETAQNFLNYINAGFYDGTIFHRVIDGFVIQGGGYEPGMKYKKPGEPIKNQADHAKPNLRGTVAMARNSNPHSATSQFFINLVDNNFLNFSDYSNEGWGYCVFGNVVHGMQAIDGIKQVPTTNKDGFRDIPVKDIIIERAYVEE